MWVFRGTGVCGAKGYMMFLGGGYVACIQCMGNHFIINNGTCCPYQHQLKLGLNYPIGQFTFRFTVKKYHQSISLVWDPRHIVDNSKLLWANLMCAELSKFKIDQIPPTHHRYK